MGYTEHENLDAPSSRRDQPLIGDVQSIQDKLRTEVYESNIIDPTEESFTKLPYLTAVVAELLRCYPPVRQLMNRISQKTSHLGNIGELPQGTYVGWNAYGVQTDTQIWGPTARDFIPERWGSSSNEILARMRKETAKGSFIVFNSHSRKCPGQDFALLQMKMVLFELVRRTKWHVAPDYKVKWSPVSWQVPNFEKKKKISSPTPLKSNSNAYSQGILSAPLKCRIVVSELPHRYAKADQN